MSKYELKERLVKLEYGLVERYGADGRKKEMEIYLVGYGQHI
jgi:hypothetical protein